MLKKKKPGLPYFNTVGGGEEVSLLTQILPSKILEKYTTRREGATASLIAKGATQMADYSLTQTLDPAGSDFPLFKESPFKDLTIHKSDYATLFGHF